VEARPYTDEEIDAAVAALTADAGRLEEAQRYVAHAAPQLQQILGAALEEGGFFGPAHDEQVLRAAGQADVDERMRSVRTLIAEETRMGMLIGVAVGFELARHLSEQHGSTPEE
jgi:hypothetical protein